MDQSKRTKAFFILLPIVVLVNILLLRYNFDKYNTLRGVDYYSTFIFLIVVLTAIDCLLLSFVLFSKKEMKKRIATLIVTAAVALGCFIPLVIMKDPDKDPRVIAASEQWLENSRKQSEAMEKNIADQEKLNKFAAPLYQNSGTTISEKAGEKLAVYGPFAVIACPYGDEDNYYLVSRPEQDGVPQKYYDNWTSDYSSAKTIILIHYSHWGHEVYRYSNGTSRTVNLYNASAEIIHMNENGERRCYMSQRIVEKINPEKNRITYGALSKFLNDKCEIK